MKISNNIEMINTERKRECMPDLDVPVIDIVRHGETAYKEFQDPDFKVEPNTADFNLDTEHLDLTEEGIKNIEKTAQKIASMVDKENEAVFLVTSPQHRALSSTLIIEKILSRNGILLLNSRGENDDGRTGRLKTLKPGLGEIPLTHKRDFGNLWLQSHKKYGKEHPEAANKPPAEVHKLVAVSLGKELSEIFLKSHGDMAHGFKNFLRHAVNIKKYLGEEAKQTLANKKLRIIAVTHEERIMDFAQKAFGLEKIVAKGQLLEINPKSTIETDSETEATVTLFGKNNKSDLSTNIKMKFSKEEGFSVSSKD